MRALIPIGVILGALPCLGSILTNCPVTLLVQPNVRSAYISRARIIEDRPMEFNFVRAEGDVGPLGKVGMWHCDVNSLGSRRDNVHHRFMNEIDWALFWHYDLKFNEDWCLKIEPQKSWNTFHGYRGASVKNEHSFSEWRMVQSLENPWAVPYYQLRTCVHPKRWTYWQTGLRRRFKLGHGFSLMPKFFAELGNEAHFVNRYGARKAAYSYDNGLQALTACVEFAWQWTPWLAIYTEVGQFALVSDEARKVTKDNASNPCLHSDLTYGTIGLRCKF